MSHSSGQYSGLFHDDEALYYEQLDKCAETLRVSAQNIVEFIDGLSNQTDALQRLRDSYTKLETIPAKNMCRGIEEIKNNLLKVEFLSKSVSNTTKDQQNFLGFFELQNAFNVEVNAFVKKVIQLEMIN